MILITPTGKTSFNSVFTNNGDVLIRDGAFTSKMERLFPYKPYIISNNLPNGAIVGTRISYSIELTSLIDGDSGNNLEVDIPIPDGLNLIKAVTSDGEYNNGVWNAVIDNENTAKLILILEVITAGTQTQIITIPSWNLTKSTVCNTVSNDPDLISYVDIPLTDETLLNHVNNGGIYSISAYNNVVDANVSGINGGIRNNRISIINAGVETFGGRVDSQSVYEQVSVTIPYNGNVEDYFNLLTPNQASAGRVNGNLDGMSTYNGSTVTYETTNPYDGRGCIKIVTDGTEEKGLELDWVGDTSKPYSIALKLYVTVAADYSIYFGWSSANKRTISLNAGLNIIKIENYTSTTADTIYIVSSSASTIYYLGGELEQGTSVHDIIPGRTSSKLNLRIYGQYKNISTAGVDRWAGICVKKGNDVIYEVPQHLINNPNLVLNDGAMATILCDDNTESAVYTLKNFQFPNLNTADIFITGVKALIDTQDMNNAIISSKLISNGISSSKKSVAVTEQTDLIKIGSESDTWELGSDKILSSDLEMTLSIINTSATAQTFNLKNLVLIIFYETDRTRGAYGFTYNGIHSRAYNIQVKDVDLPEGADPKLNVLSIARRDGDLITDTTIQAKDIEIDFRIYGDTLEEAEERLTNISKWLTNPRNEYSVPTPYELIFDFKKDKKYLAVLSDVITYDISSTKLDCKAKFKIPKGVALSTDKVTTGPYGTNRGLIKVRPVINVLVTSSNAITIIDSVSNQSMTINTNLSTGTQLIINCEDRTVKGVDGTDYSDLVDIMSVWFNILDEYSYSAINAVITSVEYTEGY